ncbi:hypothetical protein [Ancylobacter amanitiformis]|uniref:Uncharacterized protein n=1 Tax=Ancylobacter amanitiformis TaxID=217069 RepID=A0ABU0LQD8_9HYPH|nr:hypothetical protein [Ancylobacter amanitiformis]MDQ0510909.1 hypothetical protein [Ancylobacter amanitiformis]
MTGKARPLVAYPYPVGAKVEGVDAAGARFAGTVTGIIGPYSVWVDGVGTPVSLISTPPTTDDAFDYDE